LIRQVEKANITIDGKSGIGEQQRTGTHNHQECDSRNQASRAGVTLASGSAKLGAPIAEFD
jgi:hypothetical protein